ncbi:hypothetical protein H072_4475 [Dactylellina haptotyla CBS 200.50]|uniref:Nitroreductase domain-containing protein n=1 Tax=Dactylellina haptotyla (strain CBS 200.50) TaxID=1284197 RepID=S8C1W7_DACHA|nr:hypothetical protein H072_4475 [Dactylellina haptotyla CBS 200.50]
MADTKPFLQAVKDRRTYYDLKSESPISNERIQEIVKTAITSLPSSFNSQSARLVLLLNDHHKKLWDITKDSLLAIIPEAQHEQTIGRITGFKNAYATIMFFEDPQPIKELQTAFPTYADKFPQWSEHTSAIHQFTLWTALEAEGFGANLQHYSPIIDDKVKEEWGVDKSYKLVAQLVFGTPNSGPGDRPKLVTLKPLEETFKVFE